MARARASAIRLALAAGELERIAVGQVVDLDQVEEFVHLGPDLLFRPLTHLESEGHVFPHTEMAEGGVVLEAEADAA